MRVLLKITGIVVVAGCTSHVHGGLRINGAPVEPTTCVSGQTRGFPGVELADEHGDRLRFATNVDGSASAAYFPAESATGENLGSCAKLHFEPGVGVINGVRNIDGVATLSCRTEKRTIEGTVRFENCH